jgi:hypothetical protein
MATGGDKAKHEILKGKTQPSGKAFTQQLAPDALEYFNKVCEKPFSGQAVAFLNAYWPEVHTEAEFVYSVSWETIKYADMHNKGISLVYKYDEGLDVDFDIALYFFEQLNKFLDDSKNSKWKDYKMSQPQMMTAITRKQELREKVDVNYNGRMSFLEYLLDQYQSVANPADFCKRSMANPDEHPEIRKARLALEEVNKRIREYEEEKHRLTEESKGTGVKALGAKNMLAQINSSPLWEQLNKALITAEAAVRIATKKYGGKSVGGEGADGGSSDGAIWWMNRDLEEKKRRYGKK